MFIPLKMVCIGIDPSPSTSAPWWYLYLHGAVGLLQRAQRGRLPLFSAWRVAAAAAPLRWRPGQTQRGQAGGQRHQRHGNATKVEKWGKIPMKWRINMN